MKQKWSPNKLENTISFYKSLMDRWKIIKNKLPNDYYFELKFEDLIYDPKYFIKKIMLF